MQQCSLALCLLLQSGHMVIGARCDTGGVQEPQAAREGRLRAAQDGRQRLADGREGGLAAGLAAVRDQRQTRGPAGAALDRPRTWLSMGRNCLCRI